MAPYLGLNLCLSFLLVHLLCFGFALDPSDTWRDADIQQSSYVGGDHNMDPAVVDGPVFGLLWQVAMNPLEQFYAKPLVYTPSGGTQLVFLASSQNYVRTLDAKTGTIINSRQLHAPFLQSDIGCTDIPNTIGITGTPTIDIDTDTVYLFSKTYIPNYRTSGENGVFNGVYYFHGIDINTLEEKSGFPILIDGSIADNDPRRYFIGGVALQRPSLLQIGNVVYGAFGSHCDQYNYTGQIIGVDIVQQQVITNFATQTGPLTVFTTDWMDGPGGGGGVWQSGAGIATDDGSRLFIVTGNAEGHENNGVPASGSSGCQTLGESAINLNVDDDGRLSLTDYFQPYDYQNMDNGDLDYGSGGIALLDPTVFYGTGVAQIAVSAGKNGKIYILNANDLGGYKQGPGQTDLVLQTIVASDSIFGGLGSYPLEGGFIYYTPVGYPTYVWQLGYADNGMPQFNYAGESNEVSAARVGVGTPTITTYQGQPGTAILWITDPDAGLRAWYAVPDSSQTLQIINLPQIGGANKFQRPVFGNGLVYTTDSNGNVYCLGAPVNLPLNCSSVDFGNVALGLAATTSVNCTTLIPVTLNGMTVGDPTFQVSNSTLPQGQLPTGRTFSFPVTWNLTDVVLEISANATYPEVTPGIKSTSLTIYTTNGEEGYTTSFPISLAGNEVSKAAYLALSPLTVDFGGLVLGVSGEDPSATMTAQIANLGLNSMTILGYAWTVGRAIDPLTIWTNSTQDANGTWNIGPGFTSTTLPPIGAVFTSGESQLIEVTFNATNGTGEYLSYFQVYTDSSSAYVVLEGSASTAPVANFSISTPEGGWLPSTDWNMDFGPVSPGHTSSLVIQICNNGGSVLTITKSKPPLGFIAAANPGIDLHEGQTIPVNTCATGTVLFSPEPEQVNIPDFIVENTWTLNTDDLTFGVHVVNITGTVHDRQLGPVYANNGSAQYLYLGCYQDGSPRLLPNSPYTPGLQENGRCIDACSAQGYIFAGTEYMQECYCGNAQPPGWDYNPESLGLCSYGCTNDSTQACGGNGGYISIFYDQSKFSPNNQTFNTTKPPPPTTVESVGNYQYIGCYSEGTTGRALTSENVAPPAAGGSVEYCAASCAGYTYFGVEFYNECYCGNTIMNGAALINGTTPADTGCSYVCGANPSEYCGGSARLNMYQTNSTSSNTGIVCTPNAVGPVTVPTATGGPIYVPTVNTTNGLYALLGCYTEATNSRALTSQSYSNSTNTVEQCAAFCSGYTFFGVEWTLECYCGNTIEPGSVNGSSACTMTCAGNSSQYCGGPSALNMYAPAGLNLSATIASSTPPTPSTVQTVGNYDFLACYNESTNGRTLQSQSVANNSMTVEMCAAFCSEYTYFGVEFSRECYCGNSFFGGTTPQPGNSVTAGCDMPCDGNLSEYCGGSMRLNIYVQSTAPPSVASSLSSITTANSSSSSVVTISVSSLANVASSSNISMSTSSISNTSGLLSSTTSFGSSNLSSVVSSGFAPSTTNPLTASSSPSKVSSSSSGISLTTLTFSSVVSSTSSSAAVSSMSSTIFTYTSSTVSNSSSSSSASSSVSSSSSSVSSSSSSVSASSSVSRSSSSISSTPTPFPSIAACPASNQTSFTTVNGTYLIQCYTDHAGGDMPGTGFNCLEFQWCVNNCSTTPGCTAFSWVSGPKYCYLKNEIGEALADVSVWGGHMIAGPALSTTTTATA